MFYTQYSNKKTGCVCRKLRGVFGVRCMEKIEAKIDSGSGVQEKNLYSIQSTGKMLSKNGAVALAQVARSLSRLLRLRVLRLVPRNCAWCNCLFSCELCIC